ncbi:MAG: hypothetical protein R3B93_09230 [Bacteroidia bacterium]
MLDLKEAPVEKFSLVKPAKRLHKIQSVGRKTVSYFSTETAAMIWSDNLNIERVVDAPIHAEILRTFRRTSFGLRMEYTSSIITILCSV